MAKKPKVTEAWKAQAIAKGKGDGAPVVTEENYKLSLMVALGYYNTNAENTTRANAVRNYLKKMSKDPLAHTFNEVSFEDLHRVFVNNVPDYELLTIGSLVMIMNNNGFLSAIHQSEMMQKMINIYNRYNTPVSTEENKTKAPVISIEHRIIETARANSEEIDYAIDKFVKTKSSDFNIKAHLLSNNIAGAVAKRIGEYYKNTLDEVEEAIKGEDEQLVEGYSYFTKTELKKFRDFIQGIIDGCAQHQVTAKKPRIVKAKPPAIIVKKLKYMREHAELNLKSIDPANIVGANDLWVYNTKNRKLINYASADGETLSVKSTTIINYDIGRSDSKTLRKPEEFFKTTEIGKRTLSFAIKQIKAKSAVPNGRINGDMILIGAFK
jgi:hypothetical protein